MRVLILSCNTGAGHNSCAAAIKEYFESKREECEICDALSFVSDRVSKMISNGHVWIYRHAPGAFDAGYKFAEKHSYLMGEDSGTYRLLAKGAKSLFEYIEEKAFDTVLCVHVFSALMLTEVLRKYNLNITSCFVATDYTCSPGVKDTALDVYFIPHKNLIDEFMCSTISEKNTVVSGIPVRQRFYENMPAAEAKEKFGVPPYAKHLVVMCGSMGCGPMEEMVKSFAQQKSEPFHITVVCGTNEKLKEQLTELCRSRENIHIRGYVDNISQLMDSADLYLTKPGGISVTEASVKGVPMVLVDTVNGCEEYNHKFFADIDGAVSGKGADELIYISSMLLKNDMRRYEMKKHIKDVSRRQAVQIIYDEINKRVNK